MELINWKEIEQELNKPYTLVCWDGSGYSDSAGCLRVVSNRVSYLLEPYKKDSDKAGEVTIWVTQERQKVVVKFYIQLNGKRLSREITISVKKKETEASKNNGRCYKTAFYTIDKVIINDPDDNIIEDLKESYKKYLQENTNTEIAFARYISSIGLTKEDFKECLKMFERTSKEFRRNY